MIKQNMQGPLVAGFLQLHWRSPFLGFACQHDIRAGVAECLDLATARLRLPRHSALMWQASLDIFYLTNIGRRYGIGKRCHENWKKHMLIATVRVNDSDAWKFQRTW